MLITKGRTFCFNINFLFGYLKQSQKITSNQNAVRLFTTTSVNFKFDNYKNRMQSPELSEVLKLIKNDPYVLVKALRSIPRDLYTISNTWWENLIFNKKYVKQDYHDEIIDIVFKFEEEKDLEKFVVTTDKDAFNGSSTASFKITENKTALFSGNISTALPGDHIHYSGFVNVTSLREKKPFNREGNFNWCQYNTLVLKVRGDGRLYMILLQTPKRYRETWADQYVYPLYTRGGPYWQITKIPFTHFFFTKEAKISKFKSAMVNLDDIARIGFTLSDSINGPFKLEIDYIGLENIMDERKRISPYEVYTSDFLLTH